MLRTDEQFRQDVLKLPQRLQVALACACAEHVLPLYERFYLQLAQKQPLGPSSNVRQTLETAWQFALGEKVRISEIQSADASAVASIPRIDVDRSKEAEMCMAAAVAVLEALDTTNVKSLGAVERASGSALKAVMVACYLKNPQLSDKEDPFLHFVKGDLKQPEWVPLIQEFSLQNSQLDELIDLGRSSLPAEWKIHQKMQGLLLLKKLGWD